MNLKNTGMVFLSVTIAAIYYFIGSDGGSKQQLYTFLGAFNVSLFVLYLYATFVAPKDLSDYRFKLGVLIGVVIYAAVDLLINIKIFNDFAAMHQWQYPQGYPVFLSVAVLAVVIVVLLQARKTWRAWRKFKGLGGV